MKPTIVLVHDAFAESASWNKVIDSLSGAGHPVIVPSWFLIGEQDITIPAALQRFMAERAGARRAMEIPGASHAAAVSHPEETADLIPRPRRCRRPPDLQFDGQPRTRWTFIPRLEKR